MKNGDMKQNVEGERILMSNFVMCGAFGEHKRKVVVELFTVSNDSEITRRCENCVCSSACHSGPCVHNHARAPKHEDTVVLAMRPPSIWFPVIVTLSAQPLTPGLAKIAGADYGSVARRAALHGSKIYM